MRYTSRRLGIDYVRLRNLQVNHSLHVCLCLGSTACCALASLPVCVRRRGLRLPVHYVAALLPLSAATAACFWCKAVGLTALSYGKHQKWCYGACVMTKQARVACFTPSVTYVAATADMLRTQIWMQYSFIVSACDTMEGGKTGRAHNTHQIWLQVYAASAYDTGSQAR